VWVVGVSKRSSWRNKWSDWELRWGWIFDFLLLVAHSNECQLQLNWFRFTKKERKRRNNFNLQGWRALWKNCEVWHFTITNMLPPSSSSLWASLTSSLGQPRHFVLFLFLQVNFSSCLAKSSSNYTNSLVIMSLPNSFSLFFPLFFSLFFNTLSYPLSTFSYIPDNYHSLRLSLEWTWNCQDDYLKKLGISNLFLPFLCFSKLFRNECLMKTKQLNLLTRKNE